MTGPSLRTHTPPSKVPPSPSLARGDYLCLRTAKVS